MCVHSRNMNVWSCCHSHDAPNDDSGKAWNFEEREAAGKSTATAPVAWTPGAEMPLLLRNSCFECRHWKRRKRGSEDKQRISMTLPFFYIDSPSSSELGNS